MHMKKVTKSAPGGFRMRVAVLGCKQLTVLAPPTYHIGETQEQVSSLNVSSGKHDYIQIYSLLSFGILCIKCVQFSSKKSKI